jgi:signal transduction histidine kinase
VQLQAAYRLEAQRTAEQVSQWVEGQAQGVLAAAVKELATPKDPAGLEQALSRLEERHPQVQHLFLLDREGQLLWPVLPSPPLSQALSHQPGEVAPSVLRLAPLLPLAPPDSAGSSTARPARARYLEAMQTYRALLGQSDPWLRLVALDLIARCHVQLHEWEEALAVYRQLAGEYGGTIDASGVPIALGVEYEVAYIYSQLGQQQRLVQSYLEVYGKLVEYQLPLREEQRRYLSQITRQALEEIWRQHPAVSPEAQARFAALRRREQGYEQRQQFIQWFWQYRLASAIAATGTTTQLEHLSQDFNGQVASFFWIPLSGGKVVGCAANPGVLADSLNANGLLASQEDLSLGLCGLGGNLLAGTLGQGSGAWEVPVSAVPQWKVVVSAKQEETNRFVPLLNLWLAVLAVLALGGGVYGLMRLVRGRLHTAQLQADFVSCVSHELRTPLTSIRLFSELLLEQRERSDAERYSFVQTIYREGRRLEHLVQNVLLFAQGERGTPTFAFARTDLGGLVQGVVDRFQPFADREGIALQAAIAPDLPQLMADAERLESVVLDLLDNAVRYSGAGRQVEVALFARDGGVVLEVADQGPGVPARERRRIFQPFYRGQAGLRQGRSGTGLGLTLAHRIVAAHQGSIEVRGREGGGSVFAVRLPVPADEGEGA